MAAIPSGKDLVAYAASRCKLGKAESWEQLSGGTTQANYLLRTSMGIYVVRLYLTRSVEYVSFEIDILNQLSASGYPCQHPVADARGRFIKMYEDKPMAVFHYIEGEHSHDGGSRVRVASVVADMHLRSRFFSYTHPDARERYDPHSCIKAARTRLRAHGCDADFRWLADQAAQLELPENLPRGLCHCDLNPGNFLYNKGVLAAVLDFDMAAPARFIYDVGNLLYWWANPAVQGSAWRRRAAELIRTYQASRLLTMRERVHLYDAFKLNFLMGMAWFLHEPSEAVRDREGIVILNDLGRDAFQEQVFG